MLCLTIICEAPSVIGYEIVIFEESDLSLAATQDIIPPVYSSDVWADQLAL